MKVFLILLFTLICTPPFAQTPLTGVYKGVGGESYLSMKEKKGKVEGDIYEKGKNPLHLKGKVANRKITGGVWINAVVERLFEGNLKDDTLHLAIKVPNDSSYTFIGLAFKKTSDNPKINPDQLFNTDSQHPEELVGTWLHIDLKSTRKVGYCFQKNGTLQFVGYPVPSTLSIVNTTWYVKNGYLYTTFEIPGWNQNPSDRESSYQLKDNQLTIDWENAGKTETFYRKVETKK